MKSCLFQIKAAACSAHARLVGNVAPPKQQTNIEKDNPQSPPLPSKEKDVMRSHSISCPTWKPVDV